jgi:hypothetical protein
MTFRKGAGIPALQAARTHCPQGHPYSRENTYRNQGKRYCRTCHRRHALAYQARKALKDGSPGAMAPSLAPRGGQCAGAAKINSKERSG